MPDILDFIDLAVKLLLVTVFFILFVVQLSQMRNKPKPLKPWYFVIAMLMGGIGFSILIIDTILWEVNPIDKNRIVFMIFVFVLLQLFGYFWYLHYESIISVTIPKKRNLFFASLVISNLVISALYFLGFNLGLYSPFTEIWDFLGISTHEGRIVTIVSHISFAGWVSAYGIVIFIIISHNLIELKKISTTELVSIAIQFVAVTFLLLEDVLVTLNFYEDDTREVLITTGLLVLFIGLLSLLSSYLLFQPSHVQSPSIQHDYYEKLRYAFIDQKVHTAAEVDSSEPIVITELTPTKLPSTAIFILIHVLNSQAFTSYAKAIENDLNLNKSTVSYNLTLLEKNLLIERKTENLDEDQRLKAIIIGSKGIEYLFSVYLQLEKYFKLT